MQNKKGLTVLNASSLSNAFDLAMNWTSKSGQGSLFWFRGVNNTQLNLLPGAYWRPKYEEFPPLLDFVQEGSAFVPVGELDDWKTYYLAQHSGIPTRLLDWTESFVAALFFALDNWNGATTPCVWVIRPECVNRLSMNWEGLVTPEQNKELMNWLPKAIQKGPKKVHRARENWTYNSSFPLAIYPRKGNSRMIAQQGVFTIHGTKKLKLDDWIVSNAPDHNKIICKINLDGLDKKDALRQLGALGARKHTMYPDLTNYISYLRDYYQW